jgi:hypothetical protein
MVDIGGFRLHALVCGQGTPAVILEPSFSAIIFSWKGGEVSHGCD